MSSYTEKVDKWGEDVINAPQFDEETLSHCLATGDWMPIAFEWYKHVAKLLYRYAQIGLPTDRGLVDLPHRHHMILKGLLFRVAKYMTKGAKLIADGDNGDFLIAMHRMALESLVKCRWLIKKNTPELFDRYIMAGLKESLELQNNIEEMRERQGGTCVVNARLKESLYGMFAISGVTPEEVDNSKGFPQFKQLLEGLDLEDQYLYFQSIPSSQIHGDWSDLIGYHLEYDYETERFSLKSTPNRPNAFPCFVGITFALKALSEYSHFAFSPEISGTMAGIIDITQQEFEERYFNQILDMELFVPDIDDEKAVFHEEETA